MRWVIKMSPHEEMLSRVASALGAELVQRTAFVGGCATPMLITDELAQKSVRYTDDVDVIVHVLGLGQWYALEKQLKNHGFYSSGQDDVLCRLRLRDARGELIVDFMPDDAQVLGFTNKWYTQALDTAEEHVLPHCGTRVRVVRAPYFIGTKLEAYKGRGGNDPLQSRDVEDILALVDGREEVVEEIQASPEELIKAIALDLSGLIQHKDFEYVVQGFTRGSSEREHAIMSRLDRLIALRP